MMTKKFISLALALVLCLSLSVPAVAINNSADLNSGATVVNNSDSITARELQEIVSSTSACLTLEDGTTVPVDSIVTIEDIVAPRNVSPYENAYKVTLSATASNDKIVSDSGHKNGVVTASATLELIWTDGPGLKNVIKKVSGTLNVVKGTVSEATVKYGDGWLSAANWAERDVKGKTSFSYSSNSTVKCPKASYEILFQGATAALELTATSSVIQ